MAWLVDWFGRMVEVVGWMAPLSFGNMTRADKLGLSNCPPVVVELRGWGQACDICCSIASGESEPLLLEENSFESLELSLFFGDEFGCLTSELLF